MARSLILIRHGRIDSLYEGRLVGSTDVPLSTAGREQAARLTSFLSGKSPDICYSSPMNRCRETAEIAMGGTAMEIIVDDRLREAYFGDWEGMSFGEIAEKHPAGVEKWAQFDHEFSFPEGEKLGDFAERIRTVTDMLTGLIARTVAVFTHGGVIRFMLCHLLDIEMRKYVAFDIGYATAVVLTLHERRATLAGMINPEDMNAT